jgi:hypothetical protein
VKGSLENKTADSVVDDGVVAAAGGVLAVEYVGVAAGVVADIGDVAVDAVAAASVAVALDVAPVAGVEVVSAELQRLIQRRRRRTLAM